MWRRSNAKTKTKSCELPYSFYHDLIPNFWHSPVDERERGTFGWICTLARKMGAKSFIVENVIDRADVQQEIGFIYEHRDAEDHTGEVGAVAITFTSRSAKSKKSLSELGKHILAQAIIVSYPRHGRPHSYVFEGNVRVPGRGKPEATLLNNYLPMARDLTVRVVGTDYSLKGIFFCQQNGTTTACAHSAVKVVVHGASDEKLSASRLNDLLDGDAVGGGTTTLKLVAAFERLGMRPTLYDFTKRRGGQLDNPWTLLCSAVEAGSPALLIFRTGAEQIDHVLPILGYTVNSDEWHPHASDLYRLKEEGFVSSSEWIDHLIINDDLTGPLYCLSQSWLKQARSTKIPADTKAKPRGRKSAGPLIPTAAITLLPDQVDISATLAENLAYAAFQKLLPGVDGILDLNDRWWRYLLDKEPRPVFRTTIIEKERYFEHLSKMHDASHSSTEDETLGALREALPSVFWLCEISLPNLYAGNRAKLGEIFIRPSPRKWKNELETVKGFRFPGVIGWQKDGNFFVEPCGLVSHFRLIGQSAQQEW